MSNVPRRRWLRASALSALSALLLAALGPAARADQDRPFPPATRAALEAALTRAVNATHVPGVVAGVFIPGQGTWVTARGVGDLANGRPMSADDHVRIGSITKTFTVTVLLELADRQVLSLDDPVSKYVDFIPNGDNITLRMLANMTSGLGSYSENEDFVTKFLANPHKVWKPRQLVDYGLAVQSDGKFPPNVFPPGTGWHYSNTNTVLLGMILEKATGEPIGQLFQDLIIRPLGLKDTVWPSGAGLPHPYAHGYTEQTPDGSMADATHWNPSWGFTAGALISDLADLRVWARALGKGTLLSPAMQQQRLTWVNFPPLTPPGQSYGLGITINHGWLGHTGELPGYNTVEYYLPARDAVLIVEVNSDIPSDQGNPAPAIATALAQVVTPDNVPVQPPAVGDSE